MSSELIPVEPLQDDDLITRERQKCNIPEILFGEIRVGANKMILPQKYLEHSKEIRNLEVRVDDVWIISHPRSGTTWTEELVWLLCQNLDYETARSISLHQRFRFLESFMFSPPEISSEKGSTDALNVNQSRRFIKTHLSLDLLPKQLWTVKPKIIFVFRNPKDVVISRYHFSKMNLIGNYRGCFEDFAEIFLQDKFDKTETTNVDIIITNDYPLSRCICTFLEPSVDFWKMRTQNNMLFIRYEEMKQDLIPAIHKVASHLGVPLKTDEVTKLADHLDFDKMKENDAVNYFKQSASRPFNSPSDGSKFIREGKCRQWKTKMDQTLIEKFDQWSRKHAEGTDFPIHWAC